MKLDVLFIAAHPDDVELTCGGTAALLASIGKKTGIVDLTQGELSTLGSIKTRKQEASAAAKLLGVSKRMNLAISDGNIENNPSNRLKLIKVLREYRPEIIFFPHFHDRHPDHKNAHELIKEAAFYSGLEKIRTTMNGISQKSHRPRKSYNFMQTFSFEPNLIVDISDFIEIKMRAIRCYASQFSNGPKQTFINDPKFVKFIEARSRYFGFRIGVEYGEPFFAEEKINIKPQDLFTI